MSRIDYELNEAERALQIDEYQKAIAKHVRENEALQAKLKLAEDAIGEMPCACPGEKGICAKCSYIEKRYGTDIG